MTCRLTRRPKNQFVNVLQRKPETANSKQGHPSINLRDAAENHIIQRHGGVPRAGSPAWALRIKLPLLLDCFICLLSKEIQRAACHLEVGSWAACTHGKVDHAPQSARLPIRDRTFRRWRHPVCPGEEFALSICPLLS